MSYAGTFIGTCVGLAMLLGSATPAAAATSVSHLGVTWTFAADHQVGQFVTGDWWVVGPITIVNIDPKDTKNDGITMHGSMVNPQAGIEGSQGFDSRLTQHSNSGISYTPALNVAASLPLALPVNSSLLSSISFDPNRPSGTGTHYPFIKTIAILTVLPTAPPTGSFRPPYVGTDKTIRPNWNISRLNYTRLNRLAPLPSTPPLSTFLHYAVEPQIEFILGWKGRYIHPADNYSPSRFPSTNPNYGQAIANTYGAMLLAVNMDFTNAQKEPIVIRLTQLGLDIYAASLNAPLPGNGVLWTNGGGHNHGRKLPMLFAGVMLDDGAIIERSDHARHKLFQEDSQFFYVTAADVARRHSACCGRVVQEYRSEDIGMPEWGLNHIPEPYEDNRLWTAAYRDIAGSSTLPHVLAAKLMGLQGLWNQPAIFDYFETRYFPLSESKAGAGNQMDIYVRDLWNAYHDAAPPAAAAGQSRQVPVAPRNLRIY